MRSLRNWRWEQRARDEILIELLEAICTELPVPKKKKK